MFFFHQEVYFYIHVYFNQSLIQVLIFKTSSHQLRNTALVITLFIAHQWVVFINPDIAEVLMP
jgi:hypothetical protein